MPVESIRLSLCGALKSEHWRIPFPLPIAVEGTDMQSKEFSTTEHRDLRDWLATHKALAVGLWIGAFGILVPVMTGAKGYPRLPPGIPISVATGLLSYTLPRDGSGPH